MRRAGNPRNLGRTGAAAWALLTLAMSTVAAAHGQVPGVDETDMSPRTNAAPTTATARGFLYRTVVSGGKTYAYNVFIPPTYNADRPWPTILFLHGSGERGNDGFFQTEVGIGRTLRRNHGMIPAIVVMPQCPQGKTWNDPEIAKMALDALEDVSKTYRVDEKRLYLTGLSLGGRGCWYIAARTKGAFAAVLPICGGGDPKDAAKLTNVPIWAHHGTEDKNVPIAETQRIVDAVEAAGGDVRFTRIAGADHVIWDRVYGDPKVWQWLFAQERGGGSGGKSPKKPRTARSRSADK
jgi:predicted peptidase